MPRPSALPGVAMVFAVLWGHSIGYYCGHRWMHTRRMYWAHRFHHRFNVVVVPVTANAVSVAEYALAYMAPSACLTEKRPRGSAPARLPPVAPNCRFWLVRVGSGSHLGPWLAFAGTLGPGWRSTLWRSDRAAHSHMRGPRAGIGLGQSCGL